MRRVTHSPEKTLRSATLVAVALAAFASGAPDALAAKAARFRHGLRPSSSYDLESTMNVRIEADMGSLGANAPMPEKGGTDPAAGEEKAAEGTEQPAPDQTPILLEMRQDLSMRSVMTVGEATPEGDLPLECSIESLAGTIELAGQKYEVPGLPDDVLGAAGFKGRLLKGGREVQVETTGLEDLPADTRQMLSQILQVLPTFPDHKLRVGESFENPISFELPGLPMGGDLDTRGSVTYLLESLDSKEARFETRAVLSATALDTQDGAQDTHLTGSLEGTAVFDRELGVFTSQLATLTMHLSMNLNIPVHMGAGAPGEVVPETTHVEAKASGPVAIRVTPSAKKPAPPAGASGPVDDAH